MNKIIKILSFAMLTAIVFVNLGCASYMVYKGSEKKVAIRKAIITNNEYALKSLKTDKDVSLSGISVNWKEALMERPILQFGAAGVDGFIAWGAYQGIKAIDDLATSDINNSTISGPVTINNY